MRPFHGIVRGSFKVSDDLLRVNVENQRSDSSRRSFLAASSPSIILSQHQYYVLAICTNGGKFKQYRLAASWLHKLRADPSVLMALSRFSHLTLTKTCRYRVLWESGKVSKF